MRLPKAAALAALALAAAMGLAGCVLPRQEAPEPAPPLASVDYDGLTLRTGQGDIVLVLYPEAAPETVALLGALVQEHYYDGKSFGRVVPGHVIQQVERDGGSLTDDKRTVPLEAAPGYHFSAGALGIARGEDPHSGGPEFFIMDYATSHLDGNFTVVGQVVKGLDVVHRIARVPAVAFPAQAQLITDRAALVPVQITSAVLAQVTLPGQEAAHLPLQVAKNARTGDFRHSLEWPRDLRAGSASDLTWYVRPYNDTAAIPASTLSLAVDGRPVALHAESDEVLHFTWTPGTAGHHDATLLRDGHPWATLGIEA